MTEQIMLQALSRGDFDTAERLAWISGDKALTAAFVLAEAKVKDARDNPPQEALDESWEEGFDDGKEKGLAIAGLIATRHLKALAQIRTLLERGLDALMKKHPREVDRIDYAIVALSLVIDELDDFDATVRDAKDES